MARDVLLFWTMRHTKILVPCLATLVLLAGCGDGNTPNPTGGQGGSGAGGNAIEIEKPANAIEGQYIFIVDPAKVDAASLSAAAEELLAPHKGVLLQVYDGSLFGFAANNLDDTKALAMTKDGRVTGIGQDCTLELQAVQANASWNLDRIDTQSLMLDTNYTYNYTGKGVHAYIIDTGIRATHVDFGGRVTGGVAIFNDGKGTNDPIGHGTAVASIVGGAKLGVAKDIAIHPVRVDLTASSFIAGVDWVTKNRVKPAVATVALGTQSFSLLDKAVQNSIAAGVTFVTSAGNQADDACRYSPGRLPEVITVGGTTKTDAVSSDSNVGTCVDLFAPSDIVAIAHIDTDMDFREGIGTSFAAPHVAGVAALYLEKNPMATPAQVQTAVLGGSSASVTGNLNGSPNKLVYSRFSEGATQFVEVYGATDFSNANGWDSTSRRWQSLRLADVDGNGLDDICGYAPQGIICTLNTGTSFQPNTTWLPDIKDGTGWEQDKYWHNIHYVDVNNDKKADLCARNGQGIACALSNGTGFGALQQWTTDFSDAAGWDTNPKYYETIDFPDVNGDGKADVCGRFTTGVVCAVSTGTAFGPLSFLATTFSNNGDFNLDQSYWGTIRYPDVNGDGKADACGRSVVGIVCALSTGTTFESSTQWDTGFGDDKGWVTDPSKWTTIQFADVNGDKKADVCGRNADGLYCAISDGTKFNNYARWSPDYSDVQSWNTAQEYYGTVRFADINGDGKADVCGRGVEGIACEISSGTAFDFFQVWSPTFNDGSGYKNIVYTQTLQFGKVNNDARADFCMRSSTTFGCFVSN